jgi:ATP phosphoribosyltransferase regulatory subunit
MEKRKLQTPEGVQDILERECYNKRELEARIKHEFILNGYNEVETPSFEYYDVFASGIGSVRQENMLKFFDAQGRILVLRPDITMPIARMGATKLDTSSPLRLCYVGNAYGAATAYYSEQMEFTQAGLEVLGLPGAEADAEVIAIAIRSLLSSGLRDFQIDIGQVGYFKGCLQDAGFDAGDEELLRGYVDQKNMLAVELFLKERNADADVFNSIMGILSLYGGKEVLDAAQSACDNAICRAAIENLREVHSILSDFGFGEYLSIDLGLLQSMDYYSGITFKGISTTIGQPLLAGGRYDNLLLEFGKAVPATGFALGIKRTLLALEKQDALLPLPGIDYVISSSNTMRKKAYELLRAMQSEGKRVELALALDQARLEQYALSKGAQAVFVAEEK